MTHRTHPLDRCFPPGLARPQAPFAGWLVLVGLVLLALGAVAARDPADAGLYLILIASLLVWREVLADPPTRALLIVAAVCAVGIALIDALAFAEYPTPLDRQWRFATRHLLLFAFVPVGWWLAAGERGVQRFLVLAFVGLAGQLIKEFSAAEWARVLSGGRGTFGFLDAQHAALAFATALLALIAWAPRWWRPADGPPVWLQRAAGIAALVLCIAVLQAAQTRQVWLGLAAAVLAVLMLWAWRVIARPGLRRMVLTGLVLAGLTAALAMATVLQRSPVVQSAIAGDNAAVAHFIGPLDFETDRRVGTLTRLVQWRFALEHIAERPLTGYGSTTVRYLIAQSDLPAFAREGYGHIHNSYLELTLAYGVAGGLVFAGLLIVLAWRVVGAFHRGEVSAPAAHFGVAWLAFFATVNAFESYVMYRNGFVIVAIVGGSLYGLTRKARRAEKAP